MDEKNTILSDSLLIKNELNEKIFKLSLEKALKCQNLLSVKAINGIGNDYNKIDFLDDLKLNETETLKSILSNKQYTRKYSQLINDNQKYENILFFDYLLSNGLCYIEAYKKKSQKEISGFATKNIDLIKYLVGEEVPQNISKRLNPSQNDMKRNTLIFLRLRKNKEGFSIRNIESLNLNTDFVRVLPAFLITVMAKKLNTILKKKPLEIHYEDNGIRKKIYSSMSKNELTNFFETTKVKKIINNVKYDLEEASIYIPEIGASKNNHKAVKEIKLLKILNIKDFKGLEKDYSKVNLNMVIPNFKIKLEAEEDIELICKIYKKIVCKPCKDKNINVLKFEINTIIDNKQAVEGDKFLKEVHELLDEM